MADRIDFSVDDPFKIRETSEIDLIRQQEVLDALSAERDQQAIDAEMLDAETPIFDSTAEISPSIPGIEGVQTPESPIRDAMLSGVDALGSVFGGTSVQPDVVGANPMGNQALTVQGAVQRANENLTRPDLKPANPAPLPDEVPVDQLLTSPEVQSNVETGQLNEQLANPAMAGLLARSANAKTEQEQAIKETLAIDQKNAEAKIQFEGQAMLADAARAKVAAEFAQKVKEFNAQAAADYAEARKEVEDTRAELAATPWGSYWDSKSTGDKLLLGIAVGLGAYSQSQIGGQNVAMALLNNMVAAHDKSRDDHLNILKARGSMASADSLNILEGTKRLNALADGSKLADLDQITAQLNAIISQTNSPKLAANARAALATIEEKAIKEDLGIQDKLGSKITRSTHLFKPVVAGYVADSYMTKDGTGKMVRMNETQAKDNKVFLRQVPLERRMSEFENTPELLSDPQYVAIYNALTKPPPTGFTGQNITDIDQLAQIGSAIDRAAFNNPALREYAIATLHFVQLQTRGETGAAMEDSEVARNALIIMPPPRVFTAGSAIAQAHATGTNISDRRRMMENNGTAAGNLSKPVYGPIKVKQ